MNETHPGAHIYKIGFVDKRRKYCKKLQFLKPKWRQLLVVVVVRRCYSNHGVLLPSWGTLHASMNHLSIGIGEKNRIGDRDRIWDVEPWKRREKWSWTISLLVCLSVLL